jgi:hypothetical protein
VSGTSPNQPAEGQQAEPSPPGTTELVRVGDGRQAESDTGTQIKVSPMAIGPVGDTATRYGVDEEQAAFLDQAAARIKRRNKKLVILMLDSGHDLLGARNLFVHGQFTPWIKNEFPFSLRTAESWMNAVLFTDDHPDLVDKVDSTMLCKLAAPNIPLVVRDRLIAEIRENKPRRTIREVELLIKEAKTSEKATTVIEGDAAAFEFSDDREFDELSAELAESARASQELQSLLLQHIPHEVILAIAQLLTAMRIGDIQKLASRLNATQSLTNPFEEGTRPSA